MTSQAFARADADGDGKLTYHEFREFISWSGHGDGDSLTGVLKVSIHHSARFQPRAA